MSEFKGWSTCYYCGKEFTDADSENYKPQMCCSGYECGCEGKPTEPPYCIECSQPKKEEVK